MIYWLAACDAPEALDTDVEPPVEVRTWLAGVSAEGGTIAVQVESAPDVRFELADPVVIGLELSASGEPRIERIGDRAVETRLWKFTGEAGHYIVAPPVVPWARGDDHGVAQGTSLYVDMGVEAVKGGDLADISDPAPVWTMPWGLAAGAAGVVAIVFGGLYIAFRGTRTVPVVKRPDPPDVIALSAWAAVRRDATLSDFDKALALSRIFREYTEATLHFPATKNTTPETLEALGELPHLPEGNIVRAKRLLRATDRVKYAESTPGADVFDELDADLRAFIADTRPSSWEQP